MSPRSRITFEVDRSRVEIIVGLLIDQVTDFQVSEVPDEKRRNGPPRKSTAWAADSKRAILAHMREQPPGTAFDYKTLAKLLPSHNMKETSISPILSAMTADGKVKKVRRGFYALP